MDVKILAAVFATLAIVFVGMNSGGLHLGGLSGITDIFSSPPPKPDTHVQADIQFHTNNTTMKVNGNLTAEGLTHYSKGDVNINADKPIKFQGFQGTVFIEDNATISGTAEKLVTPGIQISNVHLNRETDTPLIKITGAKMVGLKFRRADINLDKVNGSSSISQTNTTVEIQSFNGNITIRPPEKKISLSGNISKVSAGATTFSGN
ncbi:MAG: hypothetical protein ABEJ87_01330 [Candidatus Nanohalobium sp.]